MNLSVTTETGIRIASFLPSATEIVCSLGLRDRLVGKSHECDYPASIERVPIVTRTRIPIDATSRQIDSIVREQFETERALYSLDVEKLKELKPDLLITQTLCDVCAVAQSEIQRAIAELRGNPKVLQLEPTTLGGMFDTIVQVALATDVPDHGQQQVQKLKHRVNRIAERIEMLLKRPSVVLLEWIDPLFSAGHWSPELVSIAGGDEMLGVPGRHSLTVDWNTLLEKDPDVLVIAACGLSIPRTLKDLHRITSREGWTDLRCVQKDRVYLVDGSAYFNRPGPRLVDSLEILAHLLHPSVHPLPDHLSGPQHFINVGQQSKGFAAANMIR